MYRQCLFPLLLLSFSPLFQSFISFSFAGVILGLFGRLLVFFSLKWLQISLGTFSKSRFLLGGKQKERGETKKKKNRSSCCTLRLSIDIGYFGDSFFGSNVFKNPARWLCKTWNTMQSTYRYELLGHSFYPNRFVILHGSIPIWAPVNNESFILFPFRFFHLWYKFHWRKMSAHASRKISRGRFPVPHKR